MRRNYELYSRNTFFCEKKCILCFLIKSVNVNAVAVNRLVFLDLYIYKFWLWSWHQDKYDPNTSKSTQRKIPRCARVQPSAIFMCLVLPFLNATTNTGTIALHSIHPSKPQTPHKNSVFTQFIFFAFHFRSADFSGLCFFFHVFFFILLLGLARTQSVYSLSGESFIRIAHNDLTFAQDKVSSFRWPIQHDYCANGIAHRKIPRLFREILLLLLGFCHFLPAATK